MPAVKSKWVFIAAVIKQVDTPMITTDHLFHLDHFFHLVHLVHLGSPCPCLRNTKYCCCLTSSYELTISCCKPTASWCELIADWVSCGTVSYCYLLSSLPDHYSHGQLLEDQN